MTRRAKAATVPKVHGPDGAAFEPLTIQAASDQPAETSKTIYPEHGTGRTAPLATCGHCTGKPLILRRCPTKGNPPTFCAVCQKCGHHSPAERKVTKTAAQEAQMVLELRQVKAIVGRLETTARKKAAHR